MYYITDSSYGLGLFGTTVERIQNNKKKNHLIVKLQINLHVRSAGFRIQFSSTLTRLS